ncbi:MAG: M9 family metallopeptidase [Tahibacter sp.]
MYSFESFLQAARRLVTGLVCIGVLHCAQAGPSEPWRTTNAPRAATEVVEDGHAQRERIDAGRRPPLPASRAHLYRDYDSPQTESVAAVCDNSLFSAASGSTLVANVRAADTSCINALFNLTGTIAGQVFGEAKMVSIANALQTQSASYPGNNSTAMLQLVLYLRAGLYVQFYHPADVGNYGASWSNAVRPALDAFVANAHFQDVNDAHGAVLSEFITLIDSAAENAHQLATVRGILDRYGPSWAASYYMKSATNNVFTVLFRGHYNSDFQTLVQGSGSGVVDTLADFITRNRVADVGTDREYLLQNAGGEIARFLQYSGSFHTNLHPKIKAVLDAFGMSGPGAGIYVRVADVTDYLDHAHCSYFNLCTFSADLEAQTLPAANARDCSATLRVRSQSLTSTQLDTVCSTVGGEEGYFHTTAQTGNVPVANDNNTKLEMVIFHSSTDYETYSGIIFGNDTNNGGIYLEGDPSQIGNQPRFLAYEAEWLRPNFEVWNLTHEYIHYLDGRFNWYGAFGDMPLDAPYSAVWYIEGFAEYLSYSYRNLVYATAVTAAANPNLFTMNQLFDSEYSTDYARTYQWGYMAVRFMFERHRDKIANLYALSRPGNYSPGYHTWLDAVRNSYNTEFHDWVVCFGSHNGDTSSCGGVAADAIFKNGFDAAIVPECTSSNAGELGNGCKRSNLAAATAGARVYLYVLVPAGRNSLNLSMSGGTGDADIYVRAGAWPTDAIFDVAPQLVGSQESVTIANPVNDYYYVMLKPHESAFSGVQVQAVWQ